MRGVYSVSGIKKVGGGGLPFKVVWTTLGEVMLPFSRYYAIMYPPIRQLSKHYIIDIPISGPKPLALPKNVGKALPHSLALPTSSVALPSQP